jgi:hypothetical protein
VEDGLNAFGTGPGEMIQPSFSPFVTWKDLDNVIVKSVDKAYERQDPRLKKIESSVRSIKRTCKKREQLCPALNIDAKIAYNKKVREAEQDERQDKASFWIDYGKQIVVGAGAVILVIISTGIGILLAVKGVIP